MRVPGPEFFVPANKKTIAGMARSYGCPAITSDLASVNQRLMSPYFGDLAEWLCKAVCQPSQMARCFISRFMLLCLVAPIETVDIFAQLR